MRLFGRKNNILVIGCNGMLGYDVFDSLAGVRGCSVVGMDVQDGVDLTARHALDSFLERSSVKFDWCVNCAAYTDTKSAETSVSGRADDYALNALAPKYIAESCRDFGIRLIHVSTDYVFSERSASHRPHARMQPLFVPDDEPFPKNVYGVDKLLGEENIRRVFGENSRSYAILRTSWLYGARNSKSFVHKFMLNAVKSAVSEIHVTENERSVPTSTGYVAGCVRQVVSNRLYGTFHAVPTAPETGVSRLEFAEEIVRCVGTRWADSPIAGLSLKPCEVNSYYPFFSAMKSDIGSGVPWKEDLHAFMDTNWDSLRGWIEETATSSRMTEA